MKEVVEVDLGDVFALLAVVLLALSLFLLRRREIKARTLRFCKANLFEMVMLKGQSRQVIHIVQSLPEETRHTFCGLIELTDGFAFVETYEVSQKAICQICANRFNANWRAVRRASDDDI